MNRRLLYVTAAVCVASIGDILTTVYGIESGVMYEANPYVRQQLQAGGYPLWILLKATGAMAVVALYAFSRRIVADGWEWAGIVAPAMWIASHAVVTAYNGLLIVAAG